MIYKVEGFTFETEEAARLAGKEAEGIRYMRSRNDMDDPDAVLKLYNRLIEKEIFSTPVGFGFLEELESYLLTVPYIRKEQLLPLPVSHSKQLQARPDAQEKTADVRQPDGGTERRTKSAEPSRTEGRTRSAEPPKTVPARAQGERDYRGPFYVSTFFAVVFAVALIGIFIIILMSTDNVTILNYENKLVDRYEQWEVDLQQRELKLKQREMDLREREEALEKQTAAQPETNP